MLVKLEVFSCFVGSRTKAGCKALEELPLTMQRLGTISLEYTFGHSRLHTCL